MVAEVLFAVHTDKWPTWGAHYCRTLPQMLRAERRSNFRDECLQAYGTDARGQTALFEELSGEAELCFATLTPPEPSLLASRRTSSGTPARAQNYVSMPDEFMRGGGCFGPTATVLRTSANGAPPQRVPVSLVRAGDGLVCDDGRVAPVRCVVMTECAGGKAQLTRLPNGTEITEWHPVLDAATGRWHFPVMLGQQVVVEASHVYNFVLAPGFATVLVGGVPCAALGHGLDAPVVAHPYWGTRAVIDDLMSKPGWKQGRVVLPAKEALM